MMAATTSPRLEVRNCKASAAFGLCSSMLLGVGLLVAGWYAEHPVALLLGLGFIVIGVPICLFRLSDDSVKLLLDEDGIQDLRSGRRLAWEELDRVWWEQTTRNGVPSSERVCISTVSGHDVTFEVKGLDVSLANLCEAIQSGRQAFYQGSYLGCRG